MMLKVGELAKRSGLTVRALHHYDSIGLLSPSARSDAGYRLYNRTDIARLHQVQALRRFGMPLADIGTFLASPGARLPAIVDQQIAALTRQIAQAGALRDQLTRLQRQLAEGQEPELANWLTTLEMMTMYDNYFSKEELAQLPFFNGPNACVDEWDALVADLLALMDEGVAATDARARRLAEHWMVMLERDTGGNPDFVARIGAMQAKEPALREQNGITPALEAYVGAAFAAWRLEIYRPYLTAAEFAFTEANYGKRSNEWPPLIAAVRKQMDAGAAPTSPASTQLAGTWMALFASYAGSDPATHAKFRAAHQAEPRLMTGTFITPELLAYIGAAISAAVQ